MRVGNLASQSERVSKTSMRHGELSVIFSNRNVISPPQVMQTSRWRFQVRLRHGRSPVRNWAACSRAFASTFPSPRLPETGPAAVEDLRTALRQAVEDATDEEKLTLIRSHPDLAGKLARAGTLTDASTREQAGLGLDRLSDVDYENFSQKNETYREKFGFPFIICARLTTKQGGARCVYEAA